MDGEQEQLEEDFERLNNVETIKEAIDKSLAIANEEEIGVLYHLEEIKSTFQRITPFSAKYQELLERINSVIIEFDDICSELNQQAEVVLRILKIRIHESKIATNLYCLQKASMKS